MNKRLSFLLTALLAITSFASFTMQPEQEGIKLSIGGQLIPNNVTHNINGPSSNNLFSLLGFIASCFGVALIYQGFQKKAEPIPSPLPSVRNPNTLNPTTAIETEINNTANTHGKWLASGGLLLATAGIVAIFHQKIFNS